MKRFLLFLCFIPLFASAATQNGAIDSSGDIAILAYNGKTSTSIRDDGITFLLLDDCPNGTVIVFTDANWSGTVFATNEGDVTWTNNTGSTIAKGTVVKIINAGDQQAVPASGILAQPISVNIGDAQETDAGFDMSNWDQIYAFTGSRASPGTFLTFYGDEHSINAGSSAYIDGTGLVSGQTALLKTSEGYYTGTSSCSSTLTDCLNQIYNQSNWSFADNTNYPANLPDNFTGSLFVTNNAPTAASFTAPPIYQGAAYSFATADFSYSDSDSDPIDHVRITAVPASGSLWVDTDGNGTINGAETALNNNETVSKADLDAGHLKYLNTSGTSSSFTFDVNDGTVYSASAYTATLTVTAYPTVTLSLSPSSTSEGSSATLTATLSHSFSAANTVVNLTFSGTATNGSDYSVSSSSITVNAGSTTGTATISVTDDALEETSETVITDISTVSNGTESGTQQQTLTILASDLVAPTVSISGASGTINAPFTATFTFSEAVSGFTAGDIVAGNASVSSFSSTSASVYTALITPTADGAVTVDVGAAAAQDGVGNNNTAATQLSVTYDTTAPTVSISGASGSINAPFTATFTFSEAVTGFTVGDIVAGNASVSAFNATSTSVYTALITPSADGSVTVDVAGSVAQDTAGNNNSAATQLAVTYDGTAPTVFISGASGTINAAFTATFTFSEAVTGFTAGDIVAGNGSVSAFTATSTSVYTALITPTADGAVTVDVGAAAAQDGVGNNNTAATQLSVTYDTTAPTVSISGASGSINAPFTATFTFSEAVTGFTVGDIVAGNASVSAFNATSTSVYTALITPSADGSVTVDVAGSVAQDTAGNNNSAATQLAVTYDGTAPTVSISGASGTINAPFTATFTFSEGVSGFAVGDIVASNASVSAFSATSTSVYTALITPTADGAVTVDVAGSVAQDGAGNNNSAASQLAVTYDATAPTVTISGATGTINAAFTATFTFSEAVSGFTAGGIVAGNASVSAFSATSASVYTALITPTADGAVTVDVAGSVAQDGAGNNNSAASQLAVTYDGTAPTVSISGASGNINSAFTATFTFNEAVSGFTVGDIVAGNASVSSFSATSASVYTALITPTADGAVTVNVAGSVAQDTAGNNNSAAMQLAVTYDGTAPTVSISGASGNINSAFTVTFTFSEAVTGFTAGDIVAGNGSVSAFTATSASVYTALITPTANGTVTVDVAGSVAQDGAGNNNSAASQLAVTYDGTAPTVSISGASGTINAAFTATFTFSEAVSGFAVGDIVAANASVSAFSATSASVYTALITPTADGTVTLDVNAAAAQDGAGNGNSAASQLSVLYDNSAPGVSISASSSVNGPFTATFTFTESVSGFTVGDIVAGNASVSSLGGSGAVYTAQITPASSGTVTLDVAAGVVTDAVGNLNTAASQLSVTYDGTAPSLAITGASGSVNSAFTATFTFSENVTGFSAADISTTNASVSAFSASSASVYTALITPAADGSVSVSVAANAAQDGALNGNTSASLSVTYDATAPTLAITGAAAKVNAPFTATFTFSESISGFAVSDVALTNANGSNFQTLSASSYSLDITPVADGAVTVAVAAAAAADAAGNTSNAASLNTTYDGTAPALTISGASGSINSDFTATFSFSEDVTGFSAADISLSNASGSNFQTLSASSYSLGITPAADGTVAINVAAAAASDDSGNGNTAGSLSVTYDHTAPTVTIGGASGAVTAPFTATFTFSEAVDDFVATDVTLTNATQGTFTKVSATEYRLGINPTAVGQVVVTVAANSAHDAATNGNTQGSLSVDYQDAAPTVSLQGPALATGTFTLTLQFSETVTVLNAADVVVGNGTLLSLTGSDALYSAEIQPTTLGSAVTISLAAGVVQDLGGQDNQAAIQTIFTNNNGSVAISGLAVEGQQLLAQVDDADGINSATLTYQWLSDANPVGNAATYTVAATDVDHSISVQVSYTDNLGRQEQWTSAATDTVISIKQHALNTISGAAGNDVNAATLTATQYRQAGLDWPDDTGFTRILPIVNSAVARSQATDVDEEAELEALIALIMEAQDDDGDGLPNSLEGDKDTDRDGDGIVDREDTDSDQDGVSDRAELSLDLTDTDGDGIIDFFDADADQDGNVDDGRVDDNLDGADDNLMTVAGYRNKDPLADADSDGLLNSQDLDSDNDGIGDILENRLADADGNLMVDDPRIEIDDSNDLIDDNNDGIYNFLQLVSDGGQTDFSRTVLPQLMDADNNGRLDSTVDMDGDGLMDVVDNAVGAFGSLPDIDGDGIPNHLDTDDDGDGIPDIEENPQAKFFTGLDADADGIDDGVDHDVNGLLSGTDVDGNGVRDDREMPDSDHDGIADYLDPDSDNDGVVDGGDPSINTGNDITTATGAFSPWWLLAVLGLTLVGRAPRALLAALLLWIPLSQAEMTQNHDRHWILSWGAGYSVLKPEVSGGNRVTDDGGLAGAFAIGMQLNEDWQVLVERGLPGTAEVNSAPIDYDTTSLMAQYRLPWRDGWQWNLGATYSRIAAQTAAGFNSELESRQQLGLQAALEYQLPDGAWAGLRATRYSGDVHTLMLVFTTRID